MRGRILILLSLSLAVLLPSSSALAQSESIELPEQLRARLLSPGQLGIGWGESDAARIFVEFVPRDARGEFRAPIALEARNLSEIQDAGEALSTRPAASDGLSVLGLSAQLPASSGRVQTELVHWSWFHVDGLLLCSFQVDSAYGGELRLRWDLLDQGQREFWDGELPLHESGSVAGAWSIRLPRARWERADGSHLYLGLIDVDARARLEGEELRVGVRPSPGSRPWTLALVVASSEASFRYRSAQALRMLPSRPVESTNIDMMAGGRAMPAICHLCRQAAAEETRLRIRPVGELELQLELWVSNLEGHGRLDGESAVLGGFSMARWWTGDLEPNRARYRIPRANPAARLLVEAAAATGHVEAELRLDTGVSLPSPRAELDPVLGREHQRERAEELLPQHLSPDLLETWPNPFQERTSVRVRVPETIGEAFRFVETPPAGVDLEAAPPFGEAPVVRIKVYNVSGKLVRLLEEREAARGILQVDWDGTNLTGRPVAAGAYYISVEMGEYKVTRRVLRLRS